MKKLIVVILLLLLLFPYAAAENDSPEAVLSGLDLSAWREELQKADSTLSLDEIVQSLVSGRQAMTAEELLKRLSGIFMSALSGSLWRFIHLLAPCAVCGAIGSLRGGLGGREAARMAENVCFLMICVFMAQDLRNYMGVCEKMITAMSDMMQRLFPLLLTLLAAVGSTAGQAFFQPTVVAACGTMTALIRNVTMRFALGTAVMTILCRLNDEIRLTRLKKLFRSVTDWTLGLGFTVFISVTALQGFGAAAADGISIRTAKYAVDNFVPVVGGMFADTMDTLVGSSLLIKNALGLTGLIIILLSSAVPLAQTLAGVAVYRAAAALLEPVATEKLVGAVHDFSEVLMLFFIIQLSMSAMFMLLVSQLLVVGNLTVMLR